MRELTSVLVAVAFGMAIGMTGSAPYDMAQQNLDINATTANEVLQVAASHEAMFATLDRPDLPPGIVMTFDHAPTTKIRLS